MAKKQDIAAMLDPFEADAAKKQSWKEADAFAGTTACETRATSLVSMTNSSKEDLTAAAKAYDLIIWVFFRLAADEYITNHEW